MYPIIVIGPPRSGTSNMARIIQEEFGVLMDGKPFAKHDDVWPEGAYEDARLAIASNNLLRSRGNERDFRAFERRFRRFKKSMIERSNGKWGFKDPRIIPFFPFVLSLLDQYTIIRCHRKMQLVVKSMVQKFGWTERYAASRYARHESLLDRFLANVAHIRVNIQDEREYDEDRIIDFLEHSVVVRLSV